MTHQRRNPHIYLGGRIHRKRLLGAGMGSVLMRKGGAGAGSSYPSVHDYEEITGNHVKTTGGNLGSKLERLVVKPLHKKPQNIHFDL